MRSGVGTLSSRDSVSRSCWDCTLRLGTLSETGSVAGAVAGTGNLPDTVVDLCLRRWVAVCVGVASNSQKGQLVSMVSVEWEEDVAYVQE